MVGDRVASNGFTSFDVKSKTGFSTMVGMGIQFFFISDSNNYCDAGTNSAQIEPVKNK